MDLDDDDDSSIYDGSPSRGYPLSSSPLPPSPQFASPSRSPNPSVYSEGPFHDSPNDAEEAAGDDWDGLFFDEDDMEDESGSNVSAGESAMERAVGASFASSLPASPGRASASSDVDPQPIPAGAGFAQHQINNPAGHPRRHNRLPDNDRLPPPRSLFGDVPFFLDQEDLHPPPSLRERQDQGQRDRNMEFGGRLAGRRAAENELGYSSSADADAQEQNERIPQPRSQLLQEQRAAREARRNRQVEANRQRELRSRSRSRSRAEVIAFDMDSDMDGDNDFDELIQVEHYRQPNRRNPPQPHHYQRAPSPPTPPPQRRQRNRQMNVIDLTEEPDSPVQAYRPIPLPRHAPPPPPHHHRDNTPRHRNPRRHMSQNQRAPALARSDGSILNGNASPVIDLTGDSDDEAPPARARRRGPVAVPRRDEPERRQDLRLPAPNRLHRNIAEQLGQQIQQLQRFMPANNAGLLARMQQMLPNHLRQQRDDDVQIIGAAAAPVNGLLLPVFNANDFNPLAGNQPNFNYQADGFGNAGRAVTPKPVFEAPGASRPGFTRNTGKDPDTDEDLVAVCASCDEELKHYPDGDGDDARPAKKARTKKDREEHPFWAVRACGHVSSSCFPSTWA